MTVPATMIPTNDSAVTTTPFRRKQDTTMTETERQNSIMARILYRADWGKPYDRLLPLLSGSNLYWLNVTYGIGYES